MSVNRDLKLTPRKEGVREKDNIEVIIFSLEEIKMHFDDNIDSVRSKFSIAEALENSGKTEDAEDMFRTQLVFLESALDYYMHEITQYGLLKIFEGEWKPTERYQNILLRMETVEKALNSRETVDWFVQFVNNAYRTTAMMSWDAMKDQLNLIGIDIQRTSDEAFYAAGSAEKTREKMKRRISELFKRRNLIAHQSDRLHQNAEKQNIHKETVESFISDVEKIVLAIHNEAMRKDLVEE